MNDSNQGNEQERQDPAEQYRTDEAVQTESQEPAADEAGSDDSDESDDEGDSDSLVAVAEDPVEVTHQADDRSVSVLGDDYSVSQERGFRLNG
jgi:hypothetical protein